MWSSIHLKAATHRFPLAITLVPFLSSVNMAAVLSVPPIKGMFDGLLDSFTVPIPFFSRVSMKAGAWFGSLIVSSP